MANTRIYDSNEIQISFGGVPITEGLAQTDFLTITWESDAFTDQAGADGSVVRSKTNDGRCTIELRLLSTSPANAALSTISQADRKSPGGAGVGAFLCVDLNGTSLYAAGNCWIQKQPDITYGAEATERVWTFRAANLEDFTGGNL